MKYLVIPDSFKGSMSSEEACSIAKLQEKDGVSVAAYPAFDGGEGSVECIVGYKNGQLMTTKITDGNFLKKKASYGYFGEYAVVSVANSSGLAKTMIKDPTFTTSYGLGEHIMQAKHLGKNKILICLGGSSTNDGGAGMLCAMGAKFYNADGEFVPTGGTLCDIRAYDFTELQRNIEGMEFIALTDVKNPLLGENGCSYVFAGQKGAKTKEQRDFLEKNMTYFAEITKRYAGNPSQEGAGAAGGLGYAVQSILHGKTTSGIDWFLDCIGFETLEYDKIITGEGRLDNTSFQGKVVGGIAKRAEKIGKKMIVVCGERAVEDVPTVVERVIVLNDDKLSLSENMKNTKNAFEKAITEVFTHEK